MAPAKLMIPADLSVAQIKKILAMKEKLEKLQVRRDKIDSEIARAEGDLARLLRGSKVKPRKRKKVRKKAKKRAKKKVKKKTAKKTKRKVTKRKARKVVKKSVRKKGAKRAVRKTGKVKRAKKSRGKPTLEEVVASLIKARGKPLAFQDILKTIQKRKLFQTKSKNFANVLRRTLSTSRVVKRVGRGVYGVA
jgi:hypothetical protein